MDQCKVVCVHCESGPCACNIVLGRIRTVVLTRDYRSLETKYMFSAGLFKVFRYELVRCRQIRLVGCTSGHLSNDDSFTCTFTLNRELSYYGYFVYFFFYLENTPTSQMSKICNATMAIARRNV